MKRRDFVALVAVFALLLLAAPAVRMVRAQTIVRPVETSSQQFLDEADAGPVLVQFRTGGHRDASARGLGVFTAKGDPVRYRVLGHDPSGVTTLAIDMPDDGAEVRVHYSDQPLRDVGERVEDTQAMPVSLVMRTYHLNQRQFSGLAELQRVVEHATPLGVAPIDNIHFAHNPFGRDRGFITDIQGQLRVSETTTYSLFSSHHAAAFVVIDGEIVISDTEPAMQRDFESLQGRAKQITLEPGTHELRYLHVATDKPPRMALGSVGERRASPLPASAFVHHGSASLGPVESNEVDQPVDQPIVGFDIEQREQLGHGAALFTRYALRPIAPPPDNMHYRWDFGDSTTAQQRDGQWFEHVFVDVNPGQGETEWRVTLELIDDTGATRGSAVTQLAPAVFGHSATAENEKLLRTYAAAIDHAQYDRADREVLEAHYELLAATEQPALMAPIAAAYVERFGDRRGALAWRIKATLARHISSDDPERAVELYRELAQTADDQWQGTMAAAELLDLMIFRLEQVEGEDMESLRTTVARLYAGRSERGQALLKARLGDAHRMAGRFEQAREAYRAAEQQRHRDIEPRRAAVLKRGHRETALSYLKQGRYPAMREQLLLWEADFPTARLGDDLPLLTGRYFEAIGDDERAAIEYRALLEINPMHPSRPEIVFRLGECLWRMGETDEARDRLEEVVSEYPNSPFADEARARLQ